jgi:hypothetical protein
MAGIVGAILTPVLTILVGLGFGGIIAVLASFLVSPFRMMTQRI